MTLRFRSFGLLRRSLWLGGLMLVGLGLLLGIGGDQVLAQENGPRGAAYRGESIYSQRCVQCHGETGRGDGPMAAQAPVPIADFTDPTFVESRSPAETFDIIANGRIENLMPPWGDSLSEGEMWDLTAYIWSLGLNAAEMQAAPQTFGRSCAECHGLDGSGADHEPPLNPLGDPAWLGENEAALRAAAATDPHPTLDGLNESDLKLASTAARGFGLGLLLTEPVVAGNGVIDILVQNGTTGDVLANQETTLYIFEGDSFLTQRTVETNADGRASFGDLPTTSNWLFVAEILYDGLPFGSAMRQFEPGADTMEIAISAYEPGAARDDVVISRAHWVVTLESPNQLDMGELYVFSNSGNQVYAGDGESEGVLRFELPEGAANIGVEGGDMGGRYLVDGNVLIDTLPLAPGQRQILFRYTLPVEDGEVTIAHPIDYPVEFLNLLAPDIGVEVQAPDWGEAEEMQTQGGTFLNFTRNNVPAGTQPAATFSGIEAKLFTPVSSDGGPGRQIIDANATPGVSGQPFIPLLVVALGALVLIGGTIYVLRRQKAMQAQAPRLREEMRQELIQDIADLDDDFEADEIARSAYEAERRMLKAQLVALMRENGDQTQ